MVFLADICWHRDLYDMFTTNAFYDDWISQTLYLMHFNKFLGYIYKYVQSMYNTEPYENRAFLK